MIRRTRNHLKWSIIAIGAILTLFGVFGGGINCLVGLIPLFWIYVFLDKYKNVTKLYKNDRLKT